MKASPRHGTSGMLRGLLSVMMPFVLLGALGAGCLGPDVGEGSSWALPPAPAHERPVVVAIIDTGLNPYHEAFQRDPHGLAAGDPFVAMTGARMVELSSEGTYAERVAADEAFWSQAETGQLYAFPGTRLLALSVSHDPVEFPILDTWNHGTAVASLVMREAPEAVVVVIQTDVSTCQRPLEHCQVLMNAAPAMAWAAEQPWIDVISLSLGELANNPHHPASNPYMKPFLDASRLAYERGKVVVAGAGNAVVPPLGAFYAGPPWVISVGGAVPGSRGESPDASKGVDVVANYTEYAPRAGSTDAYGWKLGTSYSAPNVAGVLARTISAVRAHGGVATPGELREALNATAIHFQATEWDPTRPPSNETLRNLVTHSLPVVAPFAQMGWGYVNGSLAGELARRVIEDDFQVPPEKATTALYQAERQALREAYWKQHT